MTYARSRVGFSRRALDLSRINILPQHRIEFDENLLQTLAESLWQDGMFSRPVVARLTQEQVIALIDVKNHLKNDAAAPFTLSDLVASEKGDGWFDVLIAGERRIRASRMLFHDPNFAKRNGTTASPLAQNFRKLLRKGRVVVELAEGLWVTPEQFLKLQTKENSYHPPSTEELAAGYRSWYDQLRMASPGLTIGEFAEKVGRGLETIRGYFSYLEIDPEVRKRLRGASGKGSIAQALEYARLMRVARKLEDEQVEKARGSRRGLLSPAEESALRKEHAAHVESFAQALLVEIETQGYTALRIRREVDAWRDAQTSPQLGLFAGLAAEQERVARVVRRKKEQAIEARFTASITVFRKFVERTSARFARGELGLPESPFTARAVIEAMLLLHAAFLVLIRITREHLERPEWHGRHRPGSLKRVREAEQSLESEDLEPLRRAVREEERES